MAATDNFRKQHAELVEFVRKIEPLLDPQKLVTAAPEVRALLSTMIGKLSLHLAVEDNSLYPRLKQHKDTNLRELATKFEREMSGLKPVVEAFSRKWTESAIRADAAAFCAETRKVFTTLADRIQRENTVFYPAVDKAA
jgi:iron-sulfur cluster repair protein YtfE (RIC family)